MTSNLCRSIVAAVAMTAAATTVEAQTAETILVNGKIVTLDAKSSVVQALAIRGGRILAVGSN